MKFNYRGFTLIELLVVVAIIGIISAIGMVSYQGYTWTAKKQQAKLSLNSLLLAQEEYKSDNGSYLYQPSSCSASSGAQIAKALLDGRPTPSIEDIQSLAPDILRHRILPNFNAEAEGIKVDDIINQLIKNPI